MTGMELKYIFDKLINRENLEMTVLLLIFFISLVGISPVVYAGASDDNHVHVEQVNGGDNFDLTIDQFGFGNYSPAVTFLMMPVYADMLRLQAIELNDQIRKSAYSFQLRNNRLRIFPRPDSSYKLHFEYVVRSDRDNALITEHSGSSDVISDFSNVPYDNMKYGSINDVGKQWVRKYGLALTKELLGIVRSKYGAIPIPGAETSLDGDTLRSEASAEKEALVTQLREMLEQTSRKALMEADKDESEFLQEKLKKVPYPIYIG